MVRISKKPVLENKIFQPPFYISQINDFHSKTHLSISLRICYASHPPPLPAEWGICRSRLCSDNRSSQRFSSVVTISCWHSPGDPERRSGTRLNANISCGDAADLLPDLPLASANSDMTGWSRVLLSHTLDAARSY